MMRQTRLAAAFAFGAGLAVAGAALGQTQGGSAATPSSSAQPAPPAAPSAKPWAKPADPKADQPVYAVPAPPDSSSGIYLPAVVGGYVKSAAGCVVVGCDDGPAVGGSSAPPSSKPDEPPPLPPANPGASVPH